MPEALIQFYFPPPPAGLALRCPDARPGPQTRRFRERAEGAGPRLLRSHAPPEWGSRPRLPVIRARGQRPPRPQVPAPV